MNAAARTLSAATLQVQDLRRQYGALTAVDGVSFMLEPGEILCLLGSSGCGKSTLLRLIAGLEAPDAGRVVMDGNELAGPHAFVPPERRGIGLVFQDYALFPHLCIVDNVAFGLRGEPARRRNIALAALSRVRLEARAAGFPHMLSGGEQQRVALARALAPQPRLLLLDEPFSNLDRGLRETVREETLRILREAGISAILVTHDPEEALRIADRIVLMRQGRIEQDARPEVLYRQPASLYAARFFSELVELEGRVSGGSISTPLGPFMAPGLPEGAFACVALRPHDLRIAPRGVPARVVQRTFLGSCERLQLVVEGMERPLVLQVFAHGAAGPGDTIHLQADPAAALVFPADHGSGRSER